MYVHQASNLNRTARYSPKRALTSPEMNVGRGNYTHQACLLLRSTSERDLPLLFVYSQVNNGVLYVLAYVEDNLHQGSLAPRFNP